MFKNSVFRMNVNTKKWFKAAGRRMAWTIAQTMLGFLTVGATIQSVDWKVAVETAMCAGLASLCKSIIAGVPEAAGEE